MKNTSLKNEIKRLIANGANITKVEKGAIGGVSIEIEYKEPLSYDSFVYYENVANRDADFDELKAELKKNNINV